MTTRVPLVKGADGLDQQLQSSDVLAMNGLPTTAVDWYATSPSANPGAMLWSTTLGCVMEFDGTHWIARIQPKMRATIGSGDGSTTVQTLSSTTFTTINLTKVSCTGNTFNDSTHLMTCVVPGDYLFTAMMRWIDSTTQSRRCGIGIGLNSETDGPESFKWSTFPANNDPAAYADTFHRQVTLAVGDTIRLFSWQYGSMASVNCASLSGHRIP